MLSIRIKRSSFFEIRDKGKAANRLFVARNHAAIANKYTRVYMRDTCILSCMYFSSRFSEKWKKSYENWDGRKAARGRLMRREMMEFANHPALHFSLPLVLDFPDPRRNPHLPLISAPLICKPYAPYFSGA
ncbi:hypothetical protein PUN28_015921 [Cardiocondyla obscurior]|uniref:Uncharacterized protein n=1 Tax=Cardiocondyla obscurior TaxID=286306 RepID=A0AAW2ETV5_9HYME